MQPITVTRAILEAEVDKRLARHPPLTIGGICHGEPTGDGEKEIVYHDKFGRPVGVMGYTGNYVTDFCVARRFRRFGIATRMLNYLRSRGVQHVRGPFTEDGEAFMRKVSQG
jgi:GNAT superfamily N-acetyltransferase